MIGDELLRYNKEQKYIIFDCETCNLNLVDTENVPWQWAWVECTIDRVIDRKDFFVQWPRINVSKRAAEMTGFYQRTIDLQGKKPEMVLEALDAKLYDPQYKLIAHNGLNFDIYLHNIHRVLLGKKTDYSYLDRLFDTNALARSIKYEIKAPKDNLLAFQYKFTNAVQRGMKTSIEALCKEFEIEYDAKSSHDAKWDVEALRKIWLKLVWQLEI